jgi:hypothetical protein
MGDTAPRSLCLGGELLIPLRGAAVLFVHRPWISEKLQSAQTHSISTHSKTARLTIFALHHRHQPLAVHPTLVRHNGPVATRLRQFRSNPARALPENH